MSKEKTMKTAPLYYSRATYDHILRFIRARRFSDMQEATTCKKWLKKRFGIFYDGVLLQHGDPDTNGYQNYEPVINAWWAESLQSDGLIMHHLKYLIRKRKGE